MAAVTVEVWRLIVEKVGKLRDSPMGIKKKTRSLLKRFSQEDQLKEDVYHYTDSYQTLINILKEKHLRMFKGGRTPIDKVEDNEIDEEISHCFLVLKEIISEWDKKLKFSSLNPSVKVDTFGSYFEFWVKSIRFFTASFSISRDDPLLWRLSHFEKRGARFSIKIAKDYFRCKEEEKEYKWSNVQPPIIPIRIGYNDDHINQLANTISQELQHLEKKKSRCKYLNGIYNIYKNITPILPKFLSPCYKNEKEYRIYTLDIGHNPEERISPNIINEELGYQYVNSEEINSQHIKEVIIWSPKDKFEEIKSNILTDLKNDFDEKELEITLSNVPFNL